MPLCRLEHTSFFRPVFAPAAALPPDRTAPRPSCLLPAATTCLIGREQVVQAVAERLQQPTVRLLTLLGPGGVGKTRLAMEVARSLQASVADGVYFVSLASLPDPTLLPSLLLEALGDVPRDCLEARRLTGLELLKTRLSDHECLLVLDNFEHLLAASQVIAELLAAVPGLKVLVTSRAVLHLYGEHTWQVPPLELVDPRHLPELAVLGRSPAIRLFIDRAQAVQPSFELTEHVAATVAELCIRLDGLPLAIELAAARIKFFSPMLLLEHLEGKGYYSSQQASRPRAVLTFLRQQTCNVPARQKTLWETVDWSYQLLGLPEQRLLAQLSVFRGGWTVEAATAVCQGEPDLSEEMVDLLEALVNQSLIVLHPMGEDGVVEEPLGRFSLLEMVREYGLARLKESGRMPQVQRWHAQYYVALVEASAADLCGGARRGVALRLLEREQDNIRAALDFALEQPEVEMAQRFCSALFLLWDRREQAEEGLNWLEATMEWGAR